MSISDMIVVMKDGVINQTGKPQEVYDNPKNLFVAKFLGTPPISVFDGQVTGGKLIVNGDEILDVPGTEDRQVKVGIRPEGFVPCVTGKMKCTLSGIEVMGRDMSVITRNPACENPVIRAIVPADTRIDTSSAEIKFDIKPGKIFLFDHETGERIY